MYGRHILVNLPWLVDGLGTLLLDMAIFAQFFLYGEVKSIGGEVYNWLLVCQQLMWAYFYISL